jgi:hypothetical protein
MELLSPSIPECLRADETLADIYSRLRPVPLRTGIPLIDGAHNNDGLRPGDVLELAGDAGCGKTALLLHIVSALLAGTEPRGVGGGGGSGGGGVSRTLTPPRVVFFDLDGAFSATSLARSVASALLSRGPTADPLRVRVLRALERVDVHAPATAAALATALDELSGGGAAATAGALALVVLDGMGSSWHWPGRLAHGYRGAEAAQGRMASALTRLLARARPRVVWTRPLLFARVAPALREAAAGGVGRARASAAAAEAAEAAAAMAVENGARAQTPVLPVIASTLPCRLEPSQLTPVALAAAAPSVLHPRLTALVTSSVVLFRLHGDAGSPVVDDAEGAAVPSGVASAAQCVAVDADADPARVDTRSRVVHALDPSWLLSPPQQQQLTRAPPSRVHVSVALTAARCEDADGFVVESILALAA